MGTINFNKFLLILKHLKFTKYQSETEMSEKNRAKRRRKNKVAFNFVYGFCPMNIIVLRKLTNLSWEFAPRTFFYFPKVEKRKEENRKYSILSLDLPKEHYCITHFNNCEQIQS